MGLRSTAVAIENRKKPQMFRIENESRFKCRASLQRDCGL
jgi:hypothetical protein